MAIKELFLKLTSTTMPMGHERLAEPFLPAGWKKDPHGNYYYKIGKSTTMFTCHLDTADSGAPKPVTHDIKGNIIKTDGKTILGADDKAGAAVMIYMMEHKIPGLYYFFLGEERGRVGSQALSRTLKNTKDDLYKDITKVISLDRSDIYSVITYQSSERCCSDDFADDLAKKLNAAGQGLNFRKDPTGLYTDSYSFIEIYPECTNLSVGYKNQHQNGELQDIEFLQRLADACLVVDWESLVISRDHTKTEYKSYGSSYSNRGNYNNRDFGYNMNSEWEEDSAWWGGSKQSTTSGPTKSQSSADYVKDYLGDNVKKDDCVWCEYDKVYCLKTDAIWVELVGFYTTPDFDPSKVKSRGKVKPEDLRPLTKDDVKVGLDIYQADKLYGKIDEIDDEYGVHVQYQNKNTVLLIPVEKFIKQGYYVKNAESGTMSAENATRVVKPENIQTNMLIFHPIFGQGKIISVRTDRVIAKVAFKNETKDLRIDVANMKY